MSRTSLNRFIPAKVIETDSCLTCTPGTSSHDPERYPTVRKKGDIQSFCTELKSFLNAEYKMNMTYSPSSFLSNTQRLPTVLRLAYPALSEIKYSNLFCAFWISIRVIKKSSHPRSSSNQNGFLTSCVVKFVFSSLLNINNVSGDPCRTPTRIYMRRSLEASGPSPYLCTLRDLLSLDHNAIFRRFRTLRGWNFSATLSITCCTQQ